MENVVASIVITQVCVPAGSPGRVAMTSHVPARSLVQPPAPPEAPVPPRPPVPGFSELMLPLQPAPADTSKSAIPASLIRIMRTDGIRHRILAAHVRPL